MKKKEKKKLNIDEYIDIGKGDIFVYMIVTIILLVTPNFSANCS